jgi:hypothetical protein
LAELDDGAVVGSDSTKLSCDDGFDLVDHSCETDTRGGRGELSSFVTQKSIDEVQHLTSNIQRRSCPTQRVQALQDTTGPGAILVGIMELVHRYTNQFAKIKQYFSQVVLYGILFRDVMR